MKFNVPFYSQKDNTDCGIAVLKMVFSFLGKNIPYDVIKEYTNKKSRKALGTINLARLGFKTKLEYHYREKKDI